MIAEGITVLLCSFSGLILGVLSVYVYTKIRKKRIMQKPKEREKTIKETADHGTELLSRKLKEKDITMVDFNCAADGIDSTDYIKKRQSHEDDAYNILKSKKKK